jgi:hypothetical protein
MFGMVENVGVDWVENGHTSGPFGDSLARVGFDEGALRPFICPTTGKKVCSMRTGKTVMVKNEKSGEVEEVPERKSILVSDLVNEGVVPQIFNASALPYQTWQKIDRAVIRASRDRLRAAADLAAANTFGGFDGMAVTGLVRDTMTDAGSATVDMEGVQPAVNDAPQFTPDVLPLPITYSGFYVSARQLAQSRNSGVPLDTTMAEMAGRRVAETIEQMTIGVTDYSTNTVIGPAAEFTNRGIYGYITHPDNIDYPSLTAVASATAANVKDNVLAMRNAAFAQKVYGPFILYYNSSYDTLMQDDYWVYVTSGGSAPSKTIRTRLMEIEGITDIRRLDFLGTTQRLLLVSFDATFRMVMGMPLTTVQWSEQGNNKLMFRVMTIQVPDLRSQFVGTSTSTRKAPVVLGTT